MKKFRLIIAEQYCISCFYIASDYIIGLTSLCQVFELVGLTELYYAGSHGMDIMGPEHHSVSNEHPNCIKQTDKQVRDYLTVRNSCILDLQNSFSYLQLEYFIFCLFSRSVSA